jgi:serine/threonine protein kinase
MVENLMAGAQFGHFELARHLGDGEFAEVYEAYDTIAQRGVVLKVFSARCSENPAFRQRLFQEARTVAWLRHPHVVPIYSDGEIAGRVYLTMQIIDGIDLHRWLSGSALLTPSHAIAIGRQIAEALDAAHAAGLCTPFSGGWNGQLARPTVLAYLAYDRKSCEFRFNHGARPGTSRMPNSRRNSVRAA